jgi:hypothetical protein
MAVLFRSHPALFPVGAGEGGRFLWKSNVEVKNEWSYTTIT